MNSKTLSSSIMGAIITIILIVAIAVPLTNSLAEKNVTEIYSNVGALSLSEDPSYSAEIVFDKTTNSMTVDGETSTLYRLTTDYLNCSGYVSAGSLNAVVQWWDGTTVHAVSSSTLTDAISVSISEGVATITHGSSVITTPESDNVYHYDENGDYTAMTSGTTSIYVNNIKDVYCSQLLNQQWININEGELSYTTENPGNLVYSLIQINETTGYTLAVGSPNGLHLDNEGTTTFITGSNLIVPKEVPAEDETQHITNMLITLAPVIMLAGVILSIISSVISGKNKN